MTSPSSSPFWASLTTITTLAAVATFATAQASPRSLPGAERLSTLRTPSAVTWNSSVMTDAPDGSRTYVSKGRDAEGKYTELVFTETDQAYAGMLWIAGSGRWTAHGRAGFPAEFRRAAATGAVPCPGGIPASPEVEFLHELHDGGVAGSANGVCIDAETVDVLVVYTTCALEQYASNQLPPIPDPADALPVLKAECANAIAQMNTMFDESKISTPERVRHMRLVSIQPLTNIPGLIECSAAGGWVPDPANPIYGCNQLEDLEAGTPSIWCHEEDEFAADLGDISNPESPRFGGLVAQYRDMWRADFVVMLRVSNPAGPGGVGALKAQNSGCNSSSGFCVVNVNGAGGMIHEMGHNFGCCHEPGQGGAFTCSMFPYSFGHRFIVPDGTTFPLNVGTAMCYPPNDQVPRFSNPEVLWPPNDPAAQPTGTVQTQFSYWSDNARTIRETFDDVRCYRCADEPPPPVASGPVVCFGSDSHGQSTPPDDLIACTEVAAGGWHTLALETDGTVRAWGAGLTDTGPGSSGVERGQSIVPTNLTDPNHQGQTLGSCRDIAAGREHSVALRLRAQDDPLDGTVIVWGSNDYGQTDVPMDLGSCSQIAAGYFHTVALRRDGVVRAWGAGESPIIGQYPQTGQSAVPATLGTCHQVAAGAFHSMALQGFESGAGGLLVAWGAGLVSETSGGYYGFNWGQALSPVEFPPARYLDVVGGKYHTVAIKPDGTVRAWGAGTTSGGPSPRYGQSIVPPALGVATNIAAGGFHSLAIKANENLAAWGAGTTDTGVAPHFGQSIVPPGVDWIEVAAGEYHSAAIRQVGALVPCPGDFNQDGRRDGLDLTTMISAWGTPDGDCTGDGTTDGTDMTLLLSGWGFCQ